MKSNIIKSFTNKNGRLTWAILLNTDGTFTFRNYNKSTYRISLEQLIAGWWEGSVPKKVREYAIQY